MMQFVRKPMRYAHAEGHTDISYINDGNRLLTCGSDGDVRIWSGIEDDDPTSECVGEMALSIETCGDRFFVGTDNNYVQAYTFPDCKRDGVISRFSAPVTHIVASADGSLIAAGGCDMEISVTNVGTNETTKFSGHTAPILGIALDPVDKYLMSASCDGSIKIWELPSGSLVKTWHSHVPTSNDFFRAICLSRGAWQPETGGYLALPKDKSVVLYGRDTWDVKEQLSDARITQSLSILAFSPCGNYLAASSTAGEVIVWDLGRHNATPNFSEHPKKAAITGLVWHPDGKELAFCDSLGQLGVLVQAVNVGEAEDNVAPVTTDNDNYVSDDDDNENVISIKDIKASAGWMSPTDMEALKETGLGQEDDLESRSEVVPVRNLPLTDPQTAFQPSATPSHFQHRFMMWNSVGIVRCFNTEEEKSIDVEFHDTMFHHGLHMNNYEEYCLAALSDKVLALASQATDETPSKVTCVLLNAWDGSKEWSLLLPDGEAAVAIAAAGNWVAVATSRQFLRIYSYAGTQRQIISLPGPVVCLAGHQQRILLVYHQGTGLPGCQNLSCQVLDVGSVHIRSPQSPCPTPLSPQSTLKWAGFSDEGTPYLFDSEGVLHAQPPGASHWAVACDTSQHRRGPSDHHFIIGISEKLQNIRCILCKGSLYPATTPRPTVVEISLKLPFLDADSEKSVNEELFCRYMALLPVLSLNTEEYSADIDDVEKTLKQTMLKMFANACRNDSDVRATDVASMMASQTLQLAAKYASKLGKMYLTEKLGNIDPVDWIEDAAITHYRAVADDLPTGSYDSHPVYSQQDMFEDSTPSEDTNRLLLSEKENDSVVENCNSVPVTPFRANPFRVKGANDAKPKGLDFFDVARTITRPTKVEPKKIDKIIRAKSKLNKTKSNEETQPKKPTFVQWFSQHKTELQKEFPDMNVSEITKLGMKKFREEINSQKSEMEDEDGDAKKRKADNDSSTDAPVAKKSTASKLSAFAFKSGV